jgi:hypothetical protein
MAVKLGPRKPLPLVAEAARVCIALHETRNPAPDRERVATIATHEPVDEWLRVGIGT